MKRMYTWYRNLKFRNKIMILCFSVSLIPTLVLGIFCTVQCRKLLILQEEVFLHNTLEKANSSLNYFLTLYSNIIDTLAWDEAIQNAVNKEYHSNYEMFVANHEIFDVKIPVLQSMHEEVKGITLYTGTNLYTHGETIVPLQEIISEDWYPQALVSEKPFFVPEKASDTMLLIYSVPNTRYTNIFVVRLSYDAVFGDFMTLFENDYAISIYDEKGELFFDHAALAPEYRGQTLFYEHLADTKLHMDHGSFFIKSTNQNDFGWTISIFRSQRQITRSSNSFIGIIACVVLGSIAAVCYISLRLCRHIVNPLERLTENLDQIRVDDFTVTIQSEYDDEIAHLIHAFNKMANRLKDTIDELYVNRMMKQEYRLQMLQSQINPHFLYNCLSMINGKAIRSEQPEIAKIALLLSSFYRTTLNKGHSIIAVRDEWNNMTAYIELQKILHSHSFEVHLSIDERMFSYQSINLIIQPLVENAILHGLDYREEDTEPGKMSVTGEIGADWMKFTVSDNGCGMDEETLKHIWVTETKGYGIRNVDQRIKLYFGDAYGISYESKPGMGTKAVIMLPLVSCPTSKESNANPKLLLCTEI